MSELAILVPVLRRPHRVKPLLDSIEASTSTANVHFVCDPDDLEEIQAIREDGRAATMGLSRGTYMRKINDAVTETSEPLLFLGADDLEFLPGWFEAAQEQLATGAQVVGVNDLIPRNRDHTTHFLITREYAELPTIDGGRGPLHEGYFHWGCDDELIGTAKHRGVYAYAPESHVRHHHPMVGAPSDEVYELGRARARLDLKRLRRRRKLWEGP